MNWFDRMKSGIRTLVRRSMPENLWFKCERCHQTVYRKQVEQNCGICSHCGAHFRINHREYLGILIDEGSFEEIAADVRSSDPLEFEDRKRYSDRLKDSRKATGIDAAVCTGVGRLDCSRVGIGVHETGFIMGTLASAEGERICRLIDVCVRERLPLILVCRSGGARMMESALSLMQMAKVNVKLAQFSEERLPYISVLADPTTAGVSASYALIGDVNIGEPNALIGFTGERITGSSMSEDELEELRRAQRAEKVLENGFLDMVVPRDELKQTIGKLLSLLWEGAAVSTAGGETG